MRNPLLHQFEEVVLDKLHAATGGVVELHLRTEHLALYLVAANAHIAAVLQGDALLAAMRRLIGRVANQLVVQESKAINRTGVKNGIIEQVERVPLDADVAVEGIAHVGGRYLGIDADDGLAELIRGGVARIAELIAADGHVLHGTRLKPIVGVASNQDSRSTALKNIILDHHLTRSRNEHPTGTAATEMTVANLRIGRAAQVLYHIALLNSRWNRSAEFQNELLLVDLLVTSNHSLINRPHGLGLDKAYSLACATPLHASTHILHKAALQTCGRQHLDDT